MKHYILFTFPIVVFCVWGIIHEIKRPFKNDTTKNNRKQ